MSIAWPCLRRAKRRLTLALVRQLKAKRQPRRRGQVPQPVRSPMRKLDAVRSYDAELVAPSWPCSKPLLPAHLALPKMPTPQNASNWTLVHNHPKPMPPTRPSRKLSIASHTSCVVKFSALKQRQHNACAMYEKKKEQKKKRNKKSSLSHDGLFFR